MPLPALLLRDWEEKRRLMKPGKVRTRLLTGREAEGVWGGSCEVDGTADEGVELSAGGSWEVEETTEEGVELPAEEGFEPEGSTTMTGTGRGRGESSRVAGELSGDVDSSMAAGKLK